MLQAENFLIEGQIGAYYGGDTVPSRFLMQDTCVAYGYCSGAKATFGVVLECVSVRVVLLGY